MSDASLLEMAAKEFRADRNQDTFNKFVTVLENSNVVVPILLPKDIKMTPIMSAAMKEGRPIPVVPKTGTPLSPCLLKKNDETLSMPMFASIEDIPKDRKFPAIVTIPFMSCISMILSSGGKVTEAVFDPFTEIVVVGEKLINAIAKHHKAMENAQSGQDAQNVKSVDGQENNGQTAGQTKKPITMTAAQFTSFVHMRVAGDLLPKMLFAAPQEALRKLQKDKGTLMLELYTSAYPKEELCQYSEDDFTVMTLNITEEVQITRIDLPEKGAVVGIPVRIYITWKNDSELRYFVIEKGEENDNIAEITKDGKHEIIKAVQANSTEIEDVLNIVK